MNNKLDVKNLNIKKDALLNKTVTVKLLDYPDDKFVELTYIDENGKKLKERREKKLVINELKYLIDNNKVKKANKTVINDKNDRLKRPVNVYNFESSINSKKTSIRVVGSANGMYEEERKELDALTAYTRKAHLQTNGAVIRRVVAGTIVVTTVVTTFLIGLGNTLTSDAYYDLETHRERVFEENERGANLNEFGEVYTEDLYAQYKENLKDNVDTELELDTYERFWTGEDLKTLKEQKAFLNEYYERKADFNNAKEQVGKKLGN
jgi:hypothetical protein